MFTGIIEAVGEIKQIAPQENDLHLSVFSGLLDLSDVLIGDSIAVNGVCLTVTTLQDKLFTANVSPVTLSCTHGLDQPGKRVNLEKAMRLSDRLGGHLVSGHVDGTGEVVKFEAVGESHLLIIRAPHSLLRFIAHKGSITVDGVSLTINRIEGNEFSINLIPHTLSATTLHELKSGIKINLEVDMLARYVAKLLNV